MTRFQWILVSVLSVAVIGGGFLYWLSGPGQYRYQAVRRCQIIYEPMSCYLQKDCTRVVFTQVFSARYRINRLTGEVYELQDKRPGSDEQVWRLVGMEIPNQWEVVGRDDKAISGEYRCYAGYRRMEYSPDGNDPWMTLADSDADRNLTAAELGKRIKTKFPGAYNDLTDAQLGRGVRLRLAK